MVLAKTQKMNNHPVFSKKQLILVYVDKSMFSTSFTVIYYFHQLELYAF